MAKKTWKEMTREEKKIAVCKDVLKQIHLRRIRAARGSYLTKLYGDEFSGVVRPGHISDAMIGGACEACARGAVMASKVLLSGNGIRCNYGFNSEDTQRAMKGVFSVEELESIEQAFEQWKDWNACSGEAVETEETRFGNLFDNDEDRLIAIMQNIIDHKGTFRPEVKYEIVWESK